MSAASMVVARDWIHGYRHPAFPDPGHDRPVFDTGLGLYCTWTTDIATGERYPLYVRAPFFGMSGCTNQSAHGDVPLGQLHPNCLVCNQRGYCKSMCPLPEDMPGFTCTVEMDFDDQEAGWLVGEKGWNAS